MRYSGDIVRVVGLAIASVCAAMGLGCAESHAPAGFDCSGDPCDDHEPCNGVEACTADRGCLPGTPVDCDDGDSCTVDSCAAAACAHVPRDLDGDGYADPCAGGDDCAPMDAAVHPGAAEVCNQKDDDCDLDVDEGLTFQITREVVVDLPPLPGSSLPRAIAVLSDRTLVVLESSTQLAGLRDGAVFEATYREQAPSGWPRVPAGTSSLVDGETGWMIDVRGADLESPFGQVHTAFDAVEVHQFRTVEEGIEVERVRVVGPPEGERGWPALPAAGWMGGVPWVVWVAPMLGRPHVLLTRVDDDTEPPRDLGHTAGRVWDTAFAGRPEGATVFWAEGVPGPSQRLWAVRLGPGADPLGPAAIVGEADQFLLGACAMPAGEVALAWVASHSGRTDRAIVVVDASLSIVETLGTIEPPGSDEADRAPGIQCEGRSVWVVGPRSVRRIHRDGSIDVEVPVGGANATLVPSPGLWWRTQRYEPAEPSTARELSCVP